MTEDDRRFALRMIPYGVHVLTARHPGTDEVAAATVSWVTQTSFEPPLLAVALRPTSAAYRCLRAANGFVLHNLGKEDKDEAWTFRRPAVPDEVGLSGFRVSTAHNGAPLLFNAVAAIECHVHAVFEFGDHHTIVGEVIIAHVRLPPQGRPDEMMLHLAELGPTIFYGG